MSFNNPKVLLSTQLLEMKIINLGGAGTAYPSESPEFTAGF
jgi:hypothetical protein